MRSECIHWKLVCTVWTTMRFGRKLKIRRFRSYDDNLKVKWETVTQNTNRHHERRLSAYVLTAELIPGSLGATSNKQVMAPHKACDD
ncbi:hypothetical protein T265_00378 [Opisthorchis viverrini]|uniref:Uncharacterized protein n=1 Tax=Opisthorchis viverrini TaxID=6198 RepID=A0A075AJT5_OPIVI|nr:hypothetical protein T265_00378 [Opisthorchis viverrini]KER33944.1 hypothetical protein T265_00378 [Opisthorchis viverrini]